jgi:hypothetical protein
LAQVVIRRSTIDLPGLPRSLRADHARFLRNWRDVLVTYGPIYRGEAPAGGQPPLQVDNGDVPVDGRGRTVVAGAPSSGAGTWILRGSRGESLKGSAGWRRSGGLRVEP